MAASSRDASSDNQIASGQSHGADSVKHVMSQETDPLKFAPIYGPVLISPSQYIPKGYVPHDCAECGGVDGMQIGIKMCIYCAEKKNEEPDNNDADDMQSCVVKAGELGFTSGIAGHSEALDS